MEKDLEAEMREMTFRIFVRVASELPEKAKELCEAQHLEMTLKPDEKNNAEPKEAKLIATGKSWKGKNVSKKYKMVYSPSPKFIGLIEVYGETKDPYSRKPDELVPQFFVEADSTEAARRIIEDAYGQSLRPSISPK